VQQCTSFGCVVRSLTSNDPVTAAFHPAVKDSIRIRRGQLVAVDTVEDPPQIAWRWFRGTVHRMDNGLATVRITVGPPGLVAEHVPTTGVPDLAPGRDVFVSRHGEGWHLAAAASADGSALEPAGTWTAAAELVMAAHAAIA
jgi:hypothetical protein